MRTLRPLWAFVATVALGLSMALPVGQAQDSNSAVAVVSISPIEKLVQDIVYVTRASGVPEFGGIANIMIKQYTNGLDTSRPAGVVVSMVDSQPVPLAFLPIKNREVFFTALAGAGIIPDDLGKGMFSFDAGGRSIFVKDAGQWLFISQQEDDLAKVPSDPSAQLGDLPGRYGIAVRLNMKAVPQELKQIAIDQIRTGFERGMAEQQGQSAEDRAAAEEMGKASVEQMERILKEIDQVMIGWAADAKQQRVLLDTEAQFIEGTELAAQSSLLSSLTSDFTGLLIPGAAISSRFTSIISEKDKAVSKSNIRNAVVQATKKIDEEEDIPAPAKAALKKFVNGMTSVLEKTIDSGKFDGSGAVSLQDQKVTAVLGGFLADGRAAEKEVKDLVAAMGSGPGLPTVVFDYAKHKNVSLHKVTVPVKIADPAAKKLFGEELKLVVGTADKAFYLSLDPDGDALIKAAIDRAGTTTNVKVAPVEFIAEVGQILNFAQSMSPNSPLDVAVQAIREYDGKDSIRLNMTAIPRGGRYQLSIDEGVLKAAGATAKAGQPSRGGF